MSCCLYGAAGYIQCVFVSVPGCVAVCKLTQSMWEAEL